MQYTIQTESYRIICSQLEKCFLSILEDARQGSYIQREHSLALGRTVYITRIYTNIYISRLHKYLQILFSTLNYKYGTIINFIYMRTFGRTYVYLCIYICILLHYLYLLPRRCLRYLYLYILSLPPQISSRRVYFIRDVQSKRSLRNKQVWHRGARYI